MKEVVQAIKETNAEIKGLRNDLGKQQGGPPGTQRTTQGLRNLQQTPTVGPGMNPISLQSTLGGPRSGNRWSLMGLAGSNLAQTTLRTIMESLGG